MGGGGVSSSGGGEMAERDVGPTMTTSIVQHQPLSLGGGNLTSRPCSSATNSCSNSARGTNLAKLDTPDEFPAGMRVLVVDDDPICLMVLERMLHRCNYRVTTCGKATDALSLLREDINKFDLVISDVYMPDMDGFKLLELVGLEMDLPVIMMSGNGETSAVMKGITHGACDYLLKPVRIEELRNIWQHVVRKKRQDVKVVVQTKSVEEGVVSAREKRGGGEDAEYTSSANDTNDGNWKKNNKRKGEFKEENEEDLDPENDDPSTMKKPRVVWSVELHQQFVSAVNQLGIDKAVPKRILELMGVHGLTRENVASHLQKYRLYLKRLSGVSSHQSGMNPHFAGGDPFGMMSPDMGVNIANGQLTPQALAQFHLLGRMNPSNGMGFSGGLDPVLNQMFLQELPRPPHLNGMLKGSGGLLSSLPTGLPHLEQLSEPHHLPVVSDLDEYPSNTKVFPHPQLNGNLDVSIASLGATNGGLGPNPNSDTLLMHMYPRGGQQGGGSSANLGQGRGGLATSHLLGNDMNFAGVGGLGSLGGNLGSAVGLSAITGSGGGRDLSPSVGGGGSSLPSPLGNLVRRPLLGDEASNLSNSTSGGFSLAPSVQSPKHGGGGGAHGVVNEGLEQQQSLWALNYPVAQLNHGHSQGLSHDSVPWSGLAENLGLGDMGQSLSTGLSSQYSPHSQDHGIGFGGGGRGAYGRQNVSFPVSSGLDGRMVRSSYEP
ncbi:hypothetical protein M758_12G143700 [Ceratodon purpureus]|uniref:Two-component response regulator n=1 Tax=Ceratodon purpureus TaxID=3225 RepID=A0A8T0G7P8_CERPU|nr:hypothetical protein KC19_12G140100 [Ceratodon purpureus]KAG0599327.1 hypothetical protein M758_12G143700 [Ceratodon purpureus]